MVENARKPYDGFMGTKYAKLLGLVLAFVVSFAILAFLGTKYGIYMFVGIILYVIPRLFHVKDYKAMAVLGVIFLVVTSLVGGLAFSAPAMMDQTTDDIDENGFSDVIIEETTDGRYSVSVKYVGSGDDIQLHYGPVGSTCFNDIRSLNSHLVPTEVEKSSGMKYESGNTYVLKDAEPDIEIPEGKPWYVYFTAGDDTSERGMVTVNITESQVSSFALATNFSSALIPLVAFYIILLVMFLFNRKMEKVRAEMEEEGRLYPQGMGRCKECGMVILPGETVCRKCGAVIDVPEEYRRKPAEPQAQTHFECSECGATVPADSKVCPKCGATFDDDDDE